MGTIIDSILEMETEQQVNAAWKEVLSEPKSVPEIMDDLWNRIVSYQTQLFGISNTLEKYKGGERDISKLRTCLESSGVYLDLKDDQILNPKLLQWMNKKAAQLLANFSNLIARCRPLIMQTPLGWKCNQIGLSLNFPWGVGLSLNFGP